MLVGGTNILQTEQGDERGRQLSVFNRLPTEGYTQGGRFWVRGR
jgi:hypothetical protein